MNVLLKIVPCCFGAILWTLRKNNHSVKEQQPCCQWQEANLEHFRILEHFVVFLLCGKNESTVLNKTQRLAHSFEQGLCHAVTNGRLTVPKHLLLGMSLRHTTGSAEILTLFNYFGHCQSYFQVLE